MSLKVVTLNYDSYDKIVYIIKKENDEIAKIIEKVIKIEQNENIFMGKTANSLKLKWQNLDKNYLKLAKITKTTLI